jgi:hypothetical protein
MKSLMLNGDGCLQLNSEDYAIYQQEATEAGYAVLQYDVISAGSGIIDKISSLIGTIGVTDSIEVTAALSDNKHKRNVKNICVSPNSQQTVPVYSHGTVSFYLHILHLYDTPLHRDCFKTPCTHRLSPHTESKFAAQRLGSMDCLHILASIYRHTHILSMPFLHKCSCAMIIGMRAADRLATAAVRMGQGREETGWQN